MFQDCAFLPELTSRKTAVVCTNTLHQDFLTTNMAAKF